MSTDHLGVDGFFSRLAELFEAQKSASHGSIFLTQKRLTSLQDEGHSEKPHKDIDTMEDIQLSPPMSILIRASNGKSKEHSKDKVKISTIVLPEALGSFYSRYTDVCKSGMQELKKRDRSGRKKAKAKKRKEADATKKD